MEETLTELDWLPERDEVPYPPLVEDLLPEEVFVVVAVVGLGLFSSSIQSIHGLVGSGASPHWNRSTMGQTVTVRVIVSMTVLSASLLA